MDNGSKKIYWAGAGAAILLALLLALAVIIPKVVDSSWLKETIQAEVAEQVDGDFDFRKAEISILPAPYVALQQVSLNIPEAAQVNLDTIEVYPKLFPLLLGNIELNKIVIDKPDFSLPLPEKSGGKPEPKNPFSLSEILKTASSQLSPILKAIPGLKVGVHKGTLRLFAADEQVFLFENVNGSFDVSSNSLAIAISCGSNIWKSMELKGTFAPGSMEGKGKISLENMNSKVLADYFQTGKTPPVKGSFPSLQVDFTISPEAGIKANIKSSGASFAVLHEDKKISAIIDNLKGKIQHTDKYSSITVEDLTLSNPQAQLSGSFNYDRTVPSASLDIKSQNAEITGVREVLPAFISALFGNLPVVQEIFSIVRGGKVSGASFHVEGKSLDDMAVFEAMHIQGHVEEGKILLSDLGLDLQGVSGDVAISNGILEGKNMQAKLGNTTGKEGSLTLGLVQQETTPFHLDLKLNADISDLPPVLKQVLQNEKMDYYLSLFESLGGTAAGRLTIGESLESLKVRVEIDEINAQAIYKLIPYPVSVDGGRILIEGLTVQSHELKGKIGNSTFSNFSERTSWEGEPTVGVQSGTFHVVLDEIFPWLSTNKRLADDLTDINKITGIADVTVKSIKGPLLQPADLQYEVDASLKNIALTATRLPGPLNIKSGQANIIPDKITFIDLQADLLDSSLTYSAVLQNFISGKTNAEIIITNAEIDSEVNTWLTELIKAPKEYMFRTPLLISRANAKWTREELLDLQGDFSIRNGPVFHVDVMLNPDELLLRDLSLKNGEEEARIRLELKKKEIGVEFQGSLSKKTIDEILIYRDIDHNAWIKGDIKFHIYMDSLTESVATGNLDGGDFIFPWKLDKPLLLESFSLSAADKTLTLKSVEAVFEKNNYSINGDASLNKERLSLDFDVRTDTVELDKVIAAMQTDDEEQIEGETEKRVGKSWDLALDANIKIHAGSLLYNGYTWKPFESVITYENSFFGIEILKADLCSIATPGKISFHEGRIDLDFQMETSGQELSEVLICLEGEGKRATGTLNLKAHIAGQGTKDTLASSLQGDLLISAKDGFIYQDARAAKVLNVLNVTNIFRGKIPDLSTEGFHYDSFIIKGAIENGILAIDPAKLEAPIMEVVSHGTIDLPQKKLKLLVLVAPLQTVNRIQNLPIIRTILPTSLAAVPVEVTGDFSDIKVKTLSMGAVGTRTFGVMVDVLSTPVRVLEGTPEK
ncbi:AsmA-like C-terminal region-containing protein [Thermodesulfobacteriota bacterium]